MRYERKYKIENISPAVVYQIIQQHPASFRKIYPDRIINNIYFDTPAIATATDNIDGIGLRKKFRLRWYGDSLGNLSDPIFEIKIKKNLLGQKERFQWPSLNYTEVLSQVKKWQPKSGVIKNLYPTLVNSYQRSYFGTSNGKFRLTLDYNLSFGPFNRERCLLIYRNIPTVILELKYDAIEEETRQCDDIRQYLPFRQTKSSKYAMGMILLNMSPT